MLRKKIWRLPVYVWILAIPTLVVMAWGLYLLLTAYQVTNIQVKPAPQEPSVEFTFHQCSLFDGSSGSVVTDWDLAARTLTCDYSDFDEMTDGRMTLSIKNLETEKSISVNATLPASTACVEFSLTSGLPSDTLAPGIAKVYTIKAKGISGEAGTITCGGDSIGPFQASFDVELIP